MCVTLYYESESVAIQSKCSNSSCVCVVYRHTCTHACSVCACVTLIYCTIMLYTDDGVGESEFDTLAVQPSSQKMAAVRKTPLSIATSEGTCAYTRTKCTL